MARLAELDLIVEDLERANSRVATVERRNVSIRRIYLAGPLTLFQEQLRAEVEASRMGTDSETSQKVKLLESNIESLEASHEELSRALERQKSSAVDAERDMIRERESHEKQLQSKVCLRVLGQEASD